MTAPVPLRLTLEPLLPTRTPGPGGYFEYGFRMRFPDGPEIHRNDPLLAAYGARVAPVAVACDDDEQLQAGAFDPGSLVRLIAEPAEACGPDIGVWDGELLKRAGELLERPAEVVAAALECDLEQTALVLSEDRDPAEGRREGIVLLIFHPAFVVVDTSAVADFTRPAHTGRPRLVLVADGSGDVRWWDPAAAAGPIAADELSMSAELARAMQRLRSDYADLSRLDADEPRGFDRFTADLERSALDEQATALWQRARIELGRRFAVGFLGAGMERPVWSPRELESEEDDEVPF